PGGRRGAAGLGGNRRLILERGPERIESGGWDGGDVRRDYYAARDVAGDRLWIYRDCRSGQWFLHGVFA
ncbi:MAG: DNA polymerase Y family protein, partial [Pseudomonadota bacterium]